jgi:alanine-synthesizing transaminase
MMDQFPRMGRLPPYVFAVVNALKAQLRHEGQDVVDFGMGNPDLPTPRFIVDKVIEAVVKPVNHRYSVSRGIPALREAVRNWYARRYAVELDPETEVIATLGAKEGMAHLALAMLTPGDVVFSPDPSYPIHAYAPIIAGADLRGIPIGKGRDFLADLALAVRQTWPRPKLLFISYPHNPTTETVDPEFFQKIVDFAREHKIWVIHDLAYADLDFEHDQAPSFMQARGARDVGVEFFSLSTSYSMAGWRVGFCVGNRDMIQALTRIKSYLDYGIFQPIQIAAAVALEAPDGCVREIREIYRRRRDFLVEGLGRAGWPVDAPKGTMFLWAQIPEPFRAMGSVEFSKLLLSKGKVAVSPGIGFGARGDEHVRFSFIENRQRINQAVRGIKKTLAGGLR